MQYIDPTRLNPQFPSAGGMGGQPYKGDPAPGVMGFPDPSKGYGSMPAGGQAGYPTRSPMGGGMNYAGGNPYFNEGGGSPGAQSGYPTRTPMSGAATQSGYSSYLNDPAYGAAMRGGGMAYGPPGPATNLIPGSSALPPGFSWSRDDGRGGPGTGDWLVNAPARPQQLGDPRSVTTYNENGDPTTSYQYWNRIPQPLDSSTGELATVGGMLSAPTAGFSNLLAPAANQITGGSTPSMGPSPAGTGTNRPYVAGGTSSFQEGSGGALGGLLGGGLQLAGANQANLAYEEAQRRAQDAGNFTPYNVFSGTGSTTSGPGGITSTLSPQYQALRDQYLGNAGAGAAAAGSFDPNQMASQFYGQLQAQAAPGEAEQRANAIAQLQGMGQLGLGVGADTGNGPANPLYSSLLKAQADASRQRQISSYGMSQDMANQMQQRALGWGGAGLGLDQSQLQQQQIGAYLGGLSSNAALGGARLAQGPILGRGLTRGGVLSGAGGVLSSGSLPPWMQQMLGSSGNAGGIFGGAVDQYGNPTQGNFSGGDPSQYGNLGGNWDPNTGLPSDTGIDWSQFAS